MSNSFFSNYELLQLGFKKIGKNCLISKFARFYSPKTILIGDNVRIDDFCILSGNIKIGSYVHISAFVALHGSKGIIINDFSGLSPRSIVFSATDDFSGEYLINPMVPEEFTNVTGGLVELKKYVQLGANTIVMPNLTINEGAVTGVFSFVNESLDPWTINAGIPTKPIKKRSKELLKLVNKLP
jgi:acetyltransferase-like isoleucine patch superfamily enzyme